MLQAKGVRAKMLTVDPLPLTPLTFADASARSNKGLTTAESLILYNTLRDNKYLWPQNSLLLVDPGVKRLLEDLRDLAQSALPHVIPSKDDMQSRNSAILQLLRIAWGFKETSYEVAGNVMDWFEENSPKF